MALRAMTYSFLRFVSVVSSDQYCVKPADVIAMAQTTIRVHFRRFAGVFAHFDLVRDSDIEVCRLPGGATTGCENAEVTGGRWLQGASRDRFASESGHLPWADCQNLIRRRNGPAQRNLLPSGQLPFAPRKRTSVGLNAQPTRPDACHSTYRHSPLRGNSASQAGRGQAQQHASPESSTLRRLL